MRYNQLIQNTMLLLSTLLSACSGSGTDGSTTPTAPTQSTPTFIYEREFASDATLVAQSNQTIVLDLKATANPHHVTRHRFSAGLYQFCMEPGETVLSGMELVNSSGNKVVSISRGSGCVEVSLAADLYQMHTFHEVSALSTGDRVAFVRAATPNPRLTSSNGKPLGGWWAMRPEDPTGQHRTGRVRAVPNFSDGRILVQPDFTSTQFDNASLFSFTDPSYPFVYKGVVSSNPIGYFYLDFQGAPAPIVAATYTKFSQAFTNMSVTDLGSYQIQFGKSTPGSAGNFYIDDFTVLGIDHGLTFLGNDPGFIPPVAPATVSVQFRFYDDGTQIGALNEGEIALFQQCNFQGRAAVFGNDIASLSAISSSDTTLSKSAASIRLGNNTAAFLYPGANQTGTPQLIKTDTACLPGTPNTESLKIQSLVSVILLSSSSCRGCKLAGVDLSDLDLTGFDFSNAILGSSNLARTMLKGANFGNAILNSAVLDNANLEQSNLANASLISEQIGMRGASLQGAFLKNANLASAHLSGADFSNASFYGTTDITIYSNTCETDTSKCASSKTGFTCACASATGTDLDGTKFTNTYLYGVDFSGTASAQNVDFSNAVVIASNFSGRTFSIDPHSGSTTSFNAAYLHGTVLDGVTFNPGTLANAFVDFTPGGNDLSIVLSQAHTQFRHSPFQGPICVNPFYSAPTKVPPTTPSNLICPDGNSYSDGAGCGASGNARWKTPIDIGRWTTPGWYDVTPTFPPPAPPQPVCNGIPVSTNW